MDSLLSSYENKDYFKLTSQISNFIASKAGLTIENPSINFTNNPKIVKSGLDGKYGQDGDAEYFGVYNRNENSIIINLKMFNTINKLLGLSDFQIKKAILIVISHELTHAFQARHMPLMPANEREGHAVFIQDIFAAYFSIDDINLIGKKYYELKSQSNHQVKRAYIELPKKYHEEVASEPSQLKLLHQRLITEYGVRGKQFV